MTYTVSSGTLNSTIPYYTDREYWELCHPKAKAILYFTVTSELPSQDTSGDLRFYVGAVPTATVYASSKIATHKYSNHS